VLALQAAEALDCEERHKAADLFAHSAAAAAEINFTHHVALGYELSGRTLQEAGDREHAHRMLTASREAYACWGAWAKVTDVDEALASLGG
jgi:hypothetical protein